MHDKLMHLFKSSQSIIKMATELLVNIADLVNIVDGFISYAEETHQVKIDKQDLLNHLNIKKVSKPTKAKAGTAEKAERVKCKQIIKKSGIQCIKMAAPGSEFCNIHSNQKKELPKPKVTKAPVKVAAKKQTSADADEKKNKLKAVIKKEESESDEEENNELDETPNEPEEDTKKKEYVVETPKKTISLQAKNNSLSGKLNLKKN